MKRSEIVTPYFNTCKLHFWNPKTVNSLKWRIFNLKEEHHPLWSFIVDVISEKNEENLSTTETLDKNEKKSP